MPKYSHRNIWIKIKCLRSVFYFRKQINVRWTVFKLEKRAKQSDFFCILKTIHLYAWHFNTLLQYFLHAINIPWWIFKMKSYKCRRKEGTLTCHIKAPISPVLCIQMQQVNKQQKDNHLNNFANNCEIFIIVFSLWKESLVLEARVLNFKLPKSYHRTYRNNSHQANVCFLLSSNTESC